MQLFQILSISAFSLAFWIVARRLEGRWALLSCQNSSAREYAQEVRKVLEREFNVLVTEGSGASLQRKRRDVYVRVGFADDPDREARGERYNIYVFVPSEGPVPIRSLGAFDVVLTEFHSSTGQGAHPRVPQMTPRIFHGTLPPIPASLPAARQRRIVAFARSQADSDAIRSLFQRLRGGLPESYELDLHLIYWGPNSTQPLDVREWRRLLSTSLLSWHVRVSESYVYPHVPSAPNGLVDELLESMRLGCVPVVHAGPGHFPPFLLPVSLAPRIDDVVPTTAGLLLRGDGVEGLRPDLARRAAAFQKTRLRAVLDRKKISMRSWSAFRQVMEETAPALHRQPCEFANSSATRRKAVLVEPRYDPVLGTVVRNFAFFLGPEWGLIIFHGPRNAGLVRDQLAGCSNVEYRDLGHEEVDIPLLNRFLKSSAFWLSLGADYALLFQTDSILLRRGVEAFTQYDYVGAPWHRDNKVVKRTRGLLNVGNGGLSLRRVDAMVRAIELCGPTSSEAEDEDVFFARCLTHLGMRIAPVEVAVDFALEVPDSAYKVDRPLGVHAFYKYTTSARVHQVLKHLATAYA